MAGMSLSTKEGKRLRYTKINIYKPLDTFSYLFRGFVTKKVLEPDMKTKKMRPPLFSSTINYTSSSLPSGVIRTFCILPNVARCHRSILCVHEDGIVIEGSVVSDENISPLSPISQSVATSEEANCQKERVTRFPFTSVLSVAHPVQQYTFGPIAEAIRSHFDAFHCYRDKIHKTRSVRNALHTALLFSSPSSGNITSVKDEGIKCHLAILNKLLSNLVYGEALDGEEGKAPLANGQTYVTAAICEVINGGNKVRDLLTTSSQPTGDIASNNGKRGEIYRIDQLSEVIIKRPSRLTAHNSASSDGVLEDFWAEFVDLIVSRRTEAGKLRRNSLYSRQQNEPLLMSRVRGDSSNSAVFLRVTIKCTEAVTDVSDIPPEASILIGDIGQNNEILGLTLMSLRQHVECNNVMKTPDGSVIATSSTPRKRPGRSQNIVPVTVFSHLLRPYTSCQLIHKGPGVPPVEQHNFITHVITIPCPERNFPETMRIMHFFASISTNYGLSTDDGVIISDDTPDNMYIDKNHPIESIMHDRESNNSAFSPKRRCKRNLSEMEDNSVEKAAAEWRNQLIIDYSFSGRTNKRASKSPTNSHRTNSRMDGYMTTPIGHNLHLKDISNNAQKESPKRDDCSEEVQSNDCIIVDEELRNLRGAVEEIGKETVQNVERITKMMRKDIVHIGKNMSYSAESITEQDTNSEIPVSHLHPEKEDIRVEDTEGSGGRLSIKNSKRDHSGDTIQELCACIDQLYSRIADMEVTYDSDLAILLQVRRENCELYEENVMLRAREEAQSKEIANYKKKETARMRNHTLSRINSIDGRGTRQGLNVDANISSPATRQNSKPSSSEGTARDIMMEQHIEIKSLRKRCSILEDENQSLKARKNRGGSRTGELDRCKRKEHDGSSSPRNDRNALTDNNIGSSLSPSMPHNEQSIERQFASGDEENKFLKLQIAEGAVLMKRKEFEVEELRQMLKRDISSTSIADYITAICNSLLAGCETLMTQLMGLWKKSLEYAMLECDQYKDPLLLSINQHKDAVARLQIGIDEVSSRFFSAPKVIPDAASKDDIDSLSQYLAFEHERLSSLNIFLPTFKHVFAGVEQLKKCSQGHEYHNQPLNRTDKIDR